MLKINEIHHGDCLELSKQIPDKSVNLVCIDPPYNIGKSKEWDKWKTVEMYVDWMGKVFSECERILKPNGSMYFFHNDFLQVVELQNWISKNTNFKFKQLITWNKTNFKRYAWTNRNPEKCKDRNWFPNIEYCLFYTFDDETGLSKIFADHNNFKELREYLNEEKKKTGLNSKGFRELLGNGMASHYFTGGVQWTLPTRENYLKLQQTGFFQKPYDEILDMYEKNREEYEGKRIGFESQRYTFNLEHVQQNISCVWESKETNNGKIHPTAKPLDIIQKIILASSNEGDTVVDFFGGSGTTAVACINTNRNFILTERDDNFFELSKKRIEELR